MNRTLRPTFALALLLVGTGVVTLLALEPGALFEALYSYNKQNQTRMDPVDFEKLVSGGFLATIPDPLPTVSVVYKDEPPDGKTVEISMITPPALDPKENVFRGWGFDGVVATATPPVTPPVASSAAFPGSLLDVIENATKVPDRQTVPATSPTPINDNGQQAEAGKGSIRIFLGPGGGVLEIPYFYPVLPRIKSPFLGREKVIPAKRTDRFSREILLKLFQSKRDKPQ